MDRGAWRVCPWGRRESDMTEVTLHALTGATQRGGLEKGFPPGFCHFLTLA